MNDFYREYQQKLTTAEKIASLIKNGDTLASDIGVTMPTAIYTAINEYAKNHDMSDITLESSLDLIPLGCYTDYEVMKKITGVSFFTGPYARKAIGKGNADCFTSYYYRDLPHIIKKYRNSATLCATVSPMDEHGYFSFGGTASCIETRIETSHQIYLEVNKNMPRTFGGPIVHITQVDALCENNISLISLPSPVLNDKHTRIGSYIAELIPDGATIQLGIGSIPEAVGVALQNKKHLGIHTEMLTGSMIDLIKCGAVDNSLKPIHKGKTVATFAFGAQRIYDYINNNPSCLIMPVDYVNSIKTISKHPNMISINSAIQVDLYGQISSESFGTKHISGTGGQVDFVRGAILSNGGKSFIALNSTTDGDKESRIQSTLEPGSIVTTSKNDVDYVATEYGVARLRGLNMATRAEALIKIAHPKFRDQLTFDARKQGIMI